MNKKGIFITGTDTNVGKTMVTATFLAMFREDGLDAVSMKPIQTGYKKSDHDLKFHWTSAGMSVSAREANRMGPYRFKLAASPHLAAAEEGVTVSINKIASCFHQLEKKHDLVLVEGAGGVLVPINNKQTMLDVMKALALPVLVVARPTLGTINHTLLTLNALREAHLHVLGVVLSPSDPHWGKIEESNRRTIAERGNVNVMRFPFMKL